MNRTDRGRRQLERAWAAGDVQAGLALLEPRLQVEEPFRVRRQDPSRYEIWRWARRIRLACLLGDPRALALRAHGQGRLHADGTGYTSRTLLRLLGQHWPREVVVRAILATPPGARVAETEVRAVCLAWLTERWDRAAERARELVLPRQGLHGPWWHVCRGLGFQDGASKASLARALEELGRGTRTQVERALVQWVFQVPEKESV